MFSTSFLYQIKRLMRNKDLLLWALAFPIILGTLFQMAFGDVVENNEIFKNIPVAIVTNVEQDKDLVTLLEEVSKGDNQLISLQKVEDETKAKKLLADEEIKAYIIPDSSANLYVKKSGVEQSIVKEILDKYKQTAQITTDIITKDVSLVTDQKKVEELIRDLTTDKEYIKEITLGSSVRDNMLVYFYALISMVAIYGSLFGIDIIQKLEGNISALGARRSVAPTNKFKLLLADFLASFLVHMAEICILFLYLTKVLSVNFGNDIPYVLLSTMIGSVTGITMGMFIGLLLKGRDKITEGVTLAVSLTFCFFAGLMVGDMPHIIEKACPILNRINPCTLLVQSFHSLNVYNSKSTYWGYIFNMLIIAVLFMAGSVLLLRRRKYASLS